MDKKPKGKELARLISNPHLTQDQMLDLVEKALRLGSGVVNAHTLRVYKRYVREYCVRMEQERAAKGECHGYGIGAYLLEQQARMNNKEISAGTYNQCVSAIRSVAVGMATVITHHHKTMDEVQQFAWVKQWEAVMRLTARVKVPKRRKVGQWLTRDEVQKLVNSVDRTTMIGKRDVAMLALFFGAGLRREEAVGVKRKQLTANYNGRPMILGLRGKGGKVEEVPLAEWAWPPVLDWVTRAQMGDDDFVLRGMSKNGTLHDRMTTDGVYKRLKTLCKRAGVREDHPIAPHDARRTCGGLMLEGGATMQQVQRQLRHSSMTVTALYISSVLDTRKGQAGVDKVKIDIDGVPDGVEVKVRPEEEGLVEKLVARARKDGRRVSTLLGGKGDEVLVKRREKGMSLDQKVWEEIKSRRRRKRLLERRGMTVEGVYR